MVQGSLLFSHSSSFGCFHIAWLLSCSVPKHGVAFWDFTHTHTQFYLFIYFPLTITSPILIILTPLTYWISLWHGALSWKWALLGWFQEIIGTIPQISSTHPLFECSKSLSISVAVLTLTCQTFQWIPVEKFGVLLFSTLPNAPVLTCFLLYGCWYSAGLVDGVFQATCVLGFIGITCHLVLL